MSASGDGSRSGFGGSRRYVRDRRLESQVIHEDCRLQRDDAATGSAQAVGVEERAIEARARFRESGRIADQIARDDGRGDGAGDIDELDGAVTYPVPQQQISKARNPRE